jgi:hypothetical protein
MTLTNEQRLEMEQAGVNPDTIDKITDNLVPLETLKKAIREVQEVIGPHGAISRLQAGGIRITPGEGVGAYSDGVYKTRIQPNGTLLVGSNIEDPTTTTEVFFVEDTDYNGESFGAGDFLIGNNSSTESNVKWDHSEGQLQFRLGTTVKAYMDTDGTIRAGNGDVWMDEFGLNFRHQEGEVAFEDSNGDIGNLSIYSDADNFIVLENSFGAKGVSFLIDDAAHNVTQIDFTDTGIYLFDGNVEIPAGQTYDIDGSPHTHGTSELTNVASGTYTPTLTLVTNLDASVISADFTYIRVGNIVHVEGGLTADATAAGNTVLGISLPIASNFAGSFDATGIGSNQLSNVTGNIQADTTNDRAQLTYQAVATTNQAFRVSFNYQII